MNYVPINGLRMLAVESGILFAAFVIAYVSLRFLHPEVRQPGWLAWILGSNLRSVVLVMALALAGRALLLPVVGIPQPRINDEYSYLLMADTFSHHRLSNPTPPAWQHFETFHVNLTPTYHSKYPVSQGIALAFGQIVFHQPWIGVYLSTALLCGAICWALQAFLPPGWALLGGLLAVVRFALLSYWMNSYWGGSMAALGGALALGAVVRLFQPGLTNRRRSVLACAFAIALLILATSRPYEGLAFSIPLLAYFGYQTVRARIGTRALLRATVLPVVVIGLAGVVLMGYYNQKTTGSPLLLPYVLYQRTYPDLPLALPLFLGQRARPHVPASDPVFEKWYAVLAEEHGYQQTNTVSGLAALEARRLGINWLFYVGPALSLPVLLGFLSCLMQRRLRIAVAVTITTGAAIALSIVSQLHYFSPATVAVYLFAVAGLQYLWEQQKDGERAFVLAVCLTVVAVSLSRQTGGTAMNAAFAFRDARKWVAQQLENQPGKQLVLVAYDLQQHYPGNELVHDGADFNSEKILWARSKGEDNDRELCQAYSDRTFWSVETDDVNISLTPLDLCQHP
ncbi:MAG: hypothetical protein WBQ76_10005 [Candidatus Korobacteraceae bacterium]